MAAFDKKQTKISFNDRAGNKRTSIGRSKNTHPKNKHTRKNYKKYRGQGVPK